MSPFGRKGVTSAQMDPGTRGFISFLLDAFRDVVVDDLVEENLFWYVLLMLVAGANP